MVKSLTSALAVLLLATPALAQNTVRDWQWVTDHYKSFGIWVSACDHRDDKGETVRRCYIRHVDVYAQQPRFGAAFVFAQPSEDAAPVFEFSFESGTDFAADGFKHMRDGETVWMLDTDTCRRNRCILKGARSAELIEVLEGGGALQLTFSDRHGRDWARQWDAEGFAAAYKDFKDASAERGL